MNTNDNTVTENKTVVTYEDEQRECGLSPEHASQLVFGGIYRADPDDFENFTEISRYWGTSGKFHCMNWTFSPRVWSDGRVFMSDSYWGFGDSYSKRFQLTDENWDDIFPRFRLVMDDKKNYKPVGYDDLCLYEPQDIVEAAFDSGGWTCGKTKWVRRDAVQDPRRVLAKSLRGTRSELDKTLHVSSLNFSIRELERVIAEIDENGGLLDDADELAGRAELIESFSPEYTTLGALADGDFARWLEEDAYCPGEIYDTGGFCYRVFSADVLAKVIRKVNDVRCDGNGNAREIMREFAYVPSMDCVVSVTSEGGKALGAARFDATVHNLEQVRDKGYGMELDEYAPYHGNAAARDVLSKAKALVEAIEELRETL